MNDAPGRDESDAGPDLRKLAQDWITLWQSELAGLAVDREAQETWHAMLGLWAGAAAAMLRAMPRDDQAAAAARGWDPGQRASARPSPTGGEARARHEHAEGRAGAAAAAGGATAAVAPDTRDAAIERLTRRIAELDARLAELERGDRGGDPRRAGPGGSPGGS